MIFFIQFNAEYFLYILLKKFTILFEYLYNKSFYWMKIDIYTQHIYTNSPPEIAHCVHLVYQIYWHYVVTRMHTHTHTHTWVKPFLYDNNGLQVSGLIRIKVKIQGFSKGVVVVENVLDSLLVFLLGIFSCLKKTPFLRIIRQHRRTCHLLKSDEKWKLKNEYLCHWQIRKI